MSKKKKAAAKSKAKKPIRETEETPVNFELPMDDVTVADAPVEESSELLAMAEVEGLDLEFADDDTSSEEVHIDGDISSDDEESEADILAQTENEDEEELTASENTADELADTELAEFESADIENLEILTPEQARSIVESVLFSTDKPLSIAVIKQAFKGTNVKSKDIREALTELTNEYAQSSRGFTLIEAGGGFQLRTKAENMKFLRQSVKARPFRLSGPALEVMSIVAYKQPVTKSQIDEIRGVESGHLLRALMERHLVNFGERSDLPGKPMFYESTRKFLEIFGLRNLNELPSISEIDQLIPEGIGEVEDKETLSDLTGQLSQTVGMSYSEGEDELLKITDELTQITTSSEFFEQEKVRMREKRDLERAQNIREAMAIGETVEDKDVRWLERYDIAQAEQKVSDAEVSFVTEALDEAVAEESGGEDVALETSEDRETPSEEPRDLD